MCAVGYKKLNVWRKADDLAFQTYIATRTFPREEAFGITAQLRRSALSVPTNIAEGYGRQGKKELKHFVNIALGSLAETKYLLDFCARLDYLKPDQHKKLQNLGEEVGKLLWRFYQSILPA
ncbi:MAG: four helix bundle protein [Phycisphaerae bacterium]|nr:four helix bundle protein [Phycisphaerae bacterium]